MSWPIRIFSDNTIFLFSIAFDFSMKSNTAEPDEELKKHVDYKNKLWKHTPV